LLQHDRPRGDVIAVTDVAHAQLHEITGAQLAIDAQVEQCKLPGPAVHLQPDPDGPDFLQLERCFLADELAFVPGFRVIRSVRMFHDGLLSEEWRAQFAAADAIDRPAAIFRNVHP
jgi:hypothetical protein